MKDKKNMTQEEKEKLIDLVMIYGESMYSSNGDEKSVNKSIGIFNEIVSILLK